MPFVIGPSKNRTQQLAYELLRKSERAEKKAAQAEAPEPARTEAKQPAPRRRSAQPKAAKAAKKGKRG